MAHAATTGDSIIRRLRPMGLRLRLRDVLLLASRTLWLAFAGSALVQLAGRLLPIPDLLLWTCLPPASWLLAMLGYLLVRPLPVLRNLKTSLPRLQAHKRRALKCKRR